MDSSRSRGYREWTMVTIDCFLHTLNGTRYLKLIIMRKRFRLVGTIERFLRRTALSHTARNIFNFQLLEILPTHNI